MNLRDYQWEGFKDILKGWSVSDLIMFVLATGGGKTVTFVEIIRKAIGEGKRCMLIAHREELIIQAWNTLRANGITAGIIMADYPLKYDLPVQVCSIQTIARRANLPHADIVIIDEGHHVTRENTYFKIIKRYSSAKVLMVTATPYRLSGEGFRHIHDYKETKLILNRGYQQLKDDGWLVPLKYFAASIPDMTQVHIKAGEYIAEEAQRAMELAPLVDSYFDHAKGKSGICFTINVAHSIKVVQQYLHAGVPAEHIDANTPDTVRSRILSDFKCQLVKVVSNVGIITEGADFPNCDFTQLACPTKSLSKFLQCIGRTTRVLTGLVDGIEDRYERRRLIAASSKPHGIVLDNAGCWLDHNLPWYDHDWNRYFNGTKKDKKQVDETLEMLVFVAEDSSGNKIRTTNAKEIEGLKLIEITKEEVKKFINVKSIKEFDKLFYQFKNMKHVKKAGYVAFQEYMNYCKKNNILVVDQIWDYLNEVLINRIEKKLDDLASTRSRNLSVYPDNLYFKSVNLIKADGVSKAFLSMRRDQYNAENFRQLQEHRLSISRQTA